MKKALKITIKIIFAAVASIICIPAFIMIYLYKSADMGTPSLHIKSSDYIVRSVNDTLWCGNSYLYSDKSSGLWELYVTGGSQHRGATQGALTSGLMRYQEDVFIDQIREIIPSDEYLKFLRYFIIIFNRNLGKYIPMEYRDEIAAMAEFCTDEYNAIGTPYERQLNYHGAHDIGHTMQQYMLVGCSSFSLWGNNTQSGEIITARNFDFFVGDNFAKNKILTFAAPDSGYRYVSIGWAGMVGVLSGINEKGLTVTINASKGSVPTSAATPVSILTREILQYSSNIDEAVVIANKRKLFVSESIMISSALDGRTAIIEKTPDKTELYKPQGEKILCTNHFQSEAFAADKYNLDNIEFSDSKYRYELLEEKISARLPLDYEDVVSVLRNRYGKGNKDIGLANEMTLNQSIVHHSVIFKPESNLMWVTTTPWQSGEMICYDLTSFFHEEGYPRKVDSLKVASDSLFMADDYQRVLDYRKAIKEINTAISNNTQLTNEYIQGFLKINPYNYYTYRLVGDYYKSEKEIHKALDMYRQSLHCEIPYKNERIDIETLIKKLQRQ